MKIGELSRRCDVSVRMLRYYEAEGLLKPHRTQSGYRDYGPVDEQAVERIKLLGSAGMTLARIKQFSPCIRDDGPVFDPCDELRTALREQIRQIDQKTGKLMESRRVLESFMADIGS